MLEDYAAAQQFADETIHAVVTDWDKDALVSRFDEAELAEVTDGELEALFEFYRRTFGEALAIEPAEGRVGTQARVGTAGNGSATVGAFVAPVRFARQSGEITVVVQKFETEWLVTEFSIRGVGEPSTNPAEEADQVEAVEV